MEQSENLLEERESNVRSYSRSFPVTFTSASGSIMKDSTAKSYIDFFTGAGALNYGHNDKDMGRGVIEYIQQGGVIHGLDMATEAKIDFIHEFISTILTPRGLDYKFQFTGPTGTNAVEAALKLARMKTGRSNIIAFSHSFHGVSTGSLATTSNKWFRDASGIPLNNVCFFPFDGYLKGMDTIKYLEKMIDDPSSGVDMPAAIIVESIQGEGGINIATANWLKSIRRLTEERDIVLILDDIQAGCGRTGDFFSFEFASIQPDIVVLSKSISGFGLPMSLLLLRPELDIWKPGQHNGTFRGNNLAFVTGASALRKFWRSEALSISIKEKERTLRTGLREILAKYPDKIVDIRGRGLMYGAECSSSEYAAQLQNACFQNGLIIERSGAHDEVIKFMPALTVTNEQLVEGLSIFEEAIKCASSV